jgi:hypothetical protein
LITPSRQIQSTDNTINKHFTKSLEFIMSQLKQLLYIIVFACTATCANAAAVTWTFDNLKIADTAGRRQTFADTLTGTLDYDADTGTTSNVNLSFISSLGTATSTAASQLTTLSGTSYFFLSASYATGQFTSYAIDFDAALTNSGGTLNASRIQTIPGSTNSAANVLGSITGVPVPTASTVPEPEVSWLLGAGLIGIAGLSTRRKG